MLPVPFKSVVWGTLLGTVLSFGGMDSLWAIHVSPGYQIVVLKPGKKSKIEVTLTNNEEEDLAIEGGSKDWFVLPENEKFSAADWLTINDEDARFDLKVGETRKVTYRVKAPRKAVGELVGMATFLAESKQEKAVNVRMSVAVYVVIKGREKYDGVVDSVSIDASDGNLKAGIAVQNTGNVHMRFSGLIQIFDKEDQVVANVKIKHGNPVYPGQTKTYFGQIEGYSLPSGRYFVQASLADIDWNSKILTEKKKFKLTNKKRQVVVE